MALGWLFNFNFTATNIPVLSSITETLWIAQDQLEDPSTYGILAQNFQSILAFPFWLFSANTYGNIELQTKEVIANLPPQFYTTASLVAPYAKIRFSPAMLQGLAVLFIWVVLLWVWFGATAFSKMSAFPLFDVAFKSRVDVEANQNEVLSAGSDEVIDMMQRSRALVKRD